MSNRAVSRAEVRALVYREARLIDEGALDEWYELFTEDSLYWMPLKAGQGEEEPYNALFREDKLLLKLRIERLKSPYAYSQQPQSRSQHVLQRPEIEVFDAKQGRFRTRTAFVYFESRLDEQLMLAGVVHHEFVVVDDRLRVRRKRIDLLNPETALPSIQGFP